MLRYYMYLRCVKKRTKYMYKISLVDEKDGTLSHVFNLDESGVFILQTFAHIITNSDLSKTYRLNDAELVIEKYDNNDVKNPLVIKPQGDA